MSNIDTHTKVMGIFLMSQCFPVPGGMQRGARQPSGDCSAREAVSLTWPPQGHKVSAIGSTRPLINVLSAGQKLLGTEKRDLGPSNEEGDTG